MIAIDSHQMRLLSSADGYCVYLMSAESIAAAWPAAVAHAHFQLLRPRLQLRQQFSRCFLKRRTFFRQCLAAFSARAGSAAARQRFPYRFQHTACTLRRQTLILMNFSFLIGRLPLFYQPPPAACSILVCSASASIFAPLGALLLARPHARAPSRRRQYSISLRHFSRRNEVQILVISQQR